MLTSPRSRGQRYKVQQMSPLQHKQRLQLPATSLGLRWRGQISQWPALNAKTRRCLLPLPSCLRCKNKQAGHVVVAICCVITAGPTEVLCQVVQRYQSHDWGTFKACSILCTAQLQVIAMLRQQGWSGFCNAKAICLLWRAGGQPC